MWDVETRRAWARADYKKNIEKRRAAQRGYYRKHREACKERAKRAYASKPEEYKAAWRAYQARPSVKEARRLRTYGLTPEAYKKLLVAQYFRCAICLTPFSTLLKLHVHIDHEHSTGKVRGVLCNNCNRGLGAFEDSQTLLLYAAEYLRRSI